MPSAAWKPCWKQMPGKNRQCRGLYVRQPRHPRTKGGERRSCKEQGPVESTRAEPRWRGRGRHIHLLIETWQVRFVDTWGLAEVPSRFWGHCQRMEAPHRAHRAHRWTNVARVVANVVARQGAFQQTRRVNPGPSPGVNPAHRFERRDC